MEKAEHSTKPSINRTWKDKKNTNLVLIIAVSQVIRVRVSRTKSAVSLSRRPQSGSRCGDPTLKKWRVLRQITVGCMANIVPKEWQTRKDRVQIAAMNALSLQICYWELEVGPALEKMRQFPVHVGSRRC